jgi:hypothetical protein
LRLWIFERRIENKEWKDVEMWRQDEERKKETVVKEDIQRTSKKVKFLKEKERGME